VAAQKRLGIGGEDRAAHGQRAAAFYALLAQAADHLIAEYGVQIQFVPFWPGRDDAIAATIQGQMRHAAQSTQVTTPLTPAEAAALLGSVDMVVAVRLHALIFAAAAGVPGVGFGYARKIRGFMARTGQPDAVLDTAAAWPAVRAVLDRVWQERATRRPALLARMAELQALAEADAQRVIHLL
jgi:polysaccharide pyruvyl transferase WcaK-like protein